MARTLWAGCIAFLVVGCSSPQGPASPERVPLRHLAILYGKYRNSHQGVPPKDEAQFKQYIKSLGASQLAAAGVSGAEIDTLFVSPRDGQPYEVRYNTPPPADDGGGPAAVVVERTGKNGKRLVAYSTGKVEEIDEATYQKVRFANR
jgi:hypothetical protein